MLSNGDFEKDKGNAAFRRANYATALVHYNRAIKNAGSAAGAALFANKAAALLELEEYDPCIEQCGKALAAPCLTPTLKSKIYFRMGSAYESQDNLAKALESFETCDLSEKVAGKLAHLRIKLSPGIVQRYSKASCHTCTTALSDLKAITIGKLRLNEVNVGKVLVCRTSKDPAWSKTEDLLITLVEDPAGGLARMTVDCFCSPSDDLNAVLPIGTYVAVKEPLLRTGDAIVSQRVVRIDSPTNLVYLERSHSLVANAKWRTPEPPGGWPSSWEALEKRGRELLLAGNCALAVAAYTDAIELKRSVAPPESLAELFADRSVGYLLDGLSMDAFWDCQSALFVKPGHDAATHRLALALGKLGKYGEARDLLVKSTHAAEPTFQAEISRLNRLVREQQQGEYDLKTLLKEAAASEAPRLDHAEYNGGVEVRWISEERGNGLVALRDFAPGELLFVSKAFEAIYRSEWNIPPSKTERKRYDKTHRACMARIFQRIIKNRALMKAETNESLAPDWHRVQAIGIFNGFGSGDSEVALQSEGELPPFASFRFGFCFGGDGIWLLPSFMNHSCVPNTGMFFVGDLMFVRAAKRFSKGDELTTSYACYPADFEKRRESLVKFRFDCDCELCECDLQRAEDQPHLEDERKAFSKTFKSLLDVTQFDAVLVEKLRTMAVDFLIRLSYKNRYDHDLQRVYKVLGTAYLGDRQFIKAAEAFEVGYKAAVGNGTQADDMFKYTVQARDAFYFCFNIAYSYMLGRNFAYAKEYLRELQRVAKACWGSGDKELLEMLYPGLPVKRLFEALA